MNVSQLESWKSTQIASMTIRINAMGMLDENKPYIISEVTNLINGLVLTRELNYATIKQQLLTVYTYISINYMTVIDDPTIESRFVIPVLIDGTTLYPEANDFRNLFLETKELPELDLSYFNFENSTPLLEASYTVSGSALFETLRLDLNKNWSDIEIAFWNNFPNKVNRSTSKILYMMFNRPTMKPYDPDNVIDPKDILLDTMHFREAISNSTFKSDFYDVFPELA
jgi:hypothetical protein